MTAPRVFISYSWTTPDHEKWVMTLAEELVASGVDIVLDKWDLKEGHDAIAFMEQMVTDPKIEKVILVFDRGYAAKTDARKGGVGTEAQIISPQIYAKQEQDKFCAVIAEHDAEGKPHLPAYYKSRIYIDLSQGEKYAQEFERLVRWIFGKPLFVKPEIGKPPSYVSEPEAVQRSTGPLAKRTIDALKNDRAYAQGALEEYFAAFAREMEKYRIEDWATEYDDTLAKAIDEFLPARNEFLSVAFVLVQYGKARTFEKQIHRFFEGLVPLMHRQENVSQWREFDYDNFRFVVHELFLYVLAMLLRGEEFDAARYLLATPYYLTGGGRQGAGSFTAFRQYMSGLQARDKKLGRLSVRADLLKSRADASGIDFRYLMQADFVCYLRAQLLNLDWWPETLLWTTWGSHGPFEIFARAVSREYLAQVLVLLGIKDVGAITNLLQEYGQGKRRLPRWDCESLSVSTLVGANELGLQP